MGEQRPSRKERFPDGKHLAGNLFHVVSTPGDPAADKVQQIARDTLAYTCDVEGLEIGELSDETVEQFTAAFVERKHALEQCDDYTPGQRIWEHAALDAAKAVAPAL